MTGTPAVHSVDPLAPGAWGLFDEDLRARTLAEHDIGAMLAEPALQRMCDFAAELCAAPVALIGVIDGDRHVFLAHTGTPLSESPRETAFCCFAMVENDMMLVPDATRDPRFAANPIVTGEPGIRFYAGMPLKSEDGVPLGAVCVMDTSPREALSEQQAHGLAVLADSVMAQLRGNREGKAHRTARSSAERALDESELRFRTLAEAMPQMVWSTRPDGFTDYYNVRWYEFTGAPRDTTFGQAWLEYFHPDDHDRTVEVWQRSLQTGEPYQIEYRLRRADGEWRWALGRALPLRNAEGTIIRWFGTCTDIHEQKQASEERAVIAQELSHRIKNIFAVIAGLIGFAARRDPDFVPIAADLRERVTALGRAHDFVRPHGPSTGTITVDATLHGLLEALFAPYQDQSRPEEAAFIRITGDDLPIDDRSATPLALLFHELATNALKYGALSSGLGQVVLNIAVNGDDVTLDWQERGGPAPDPAAIARQGGFGTQLIELAAVRQLGGTISRDWRNNGLHLTLCAPTSAFRRR